jgi:hypothetical protein
MLQTTTLKRNLVPEIGEASKKIGFELTRWLPPLKETFVGSLDTWGSTRTTLGWLGTGSSFETIDSLLLHSNRWVAIHKSGHHPSLGCLVDTLLYCRASIRRVVVELFWILRGHFFVSCWTTLDTEESLFGSIRRPSWEGILSSSLLPFYQQ